MAGYPGIHCCTPVDRPKPIPHPVSEKRPIKEVLDPLGGKQLIRSNLLIPRFHLFTLIKKEGDNETSKIRRPTEALPSQFFFQNLDFHPFEDAPNPFLKSTSPPCSTSEPFARFFLRSNPAERLGFENCCPKTLLFAYNMASESGWMILFSLIAPCYLLPLFSPYFPI